LAGIVKINKAAIAYADNKRRTILAEIKENRFDYAAHFPDSPRAATWSLRPGVSLKRTVKEGLVRWLEVQEVRKAKSTFDNYVSKANHVEAKFGKRRFMDISKSELELWQAQLLKQELAPKTVNDIFTIARGIWADASKMASLKPTRWTASLISRSMRTAKQPTPSLATNSDLLPRPIRRGHRMFV
jgi:integrase